MSTCFATTQWRNGNGEETVLGSINPGTIDTAIYDNIVAPLDNLLAVGRFDCKLASDTVSQFTVGAGSVVVSNATGSVRLMVRNAAATTVDWGDIDTGSEAASTTYYVYAIASAVSDTVFTVKISLSSSLPTGVTYYKRLGYFYNDSSSAIDYIIDDLTGLYTDDNQLGFGTLVNKSASYGAQVAATDGFVNAYNADVQVNTCIKLSGYTDSAANPTTRVAFVSNFTEPGAINSNIMFPVKKGDYWKVTISGASAVVCYWTPLEYEH